MSHEEYRMQEVSPEAQELLTLFFGRRDFLEERIGFDSMYSAIYDHAMALSERYPDVGDYVLYHALIGSSPEGSKLDFPGEDSVLRWVDRELAKIENKKPPTG